MRLIDADALHSVFPQYSEVGWSARAIHILIDAAPTIECETCVWAGICDQTVLHKATKDDRIMFIDTDITACSYWRASDG